jgi:hypothetical protein
MSPRIETSQHEAVLGGSHLAARKPFTDRSTYRTIDGQRNSPVLAFAHATWSNHTTWRGHYDS